MGTTAKVFAIIQKVSSIIGIATIGILWIIMLMIGPNSVRIYFSILCPLMILTFALDVSFANAALKSLESWDKRTWIGVCNILFGIIFTGIFYLCWNPYSTTLIHKPLYAKSKTIIKRVEQPRQIEQPKPDYAQNAETLKKYKELLDCKAITKKEFDEIKKKLLSGESVDEPIINESTNEELNDNSSNALKSNNENTIVDYFDTTLYKSTLSLCRVGEMIPALVNFKKQKIEIVAGESYRYSAHYANTYQVMVNGNMLNLTEVEFVYIFLKQ